ncbi:MAG: SDR family oxidoreductase, partial [Phototrophicaceae bacterium]
MILITGATGFIGRALLPQLQRTGQPLRVLLSPRQVPSADWAGIEAIQTDYSDQETLYRAVTGVHTIIHLESAQWWGSPRDLEQIDLYHTRGLLDAARAARVGRIIYLSHLGATPSAAYPLLRVKGQVEQLIQSSGLAYTIFRPGVIFGEGDAFINHMAMILALNPFFFLMPGRGEVVLHPLHITDLVAALLQSLEHLDTLDRVLDIGGLEYITLEDLIRTVMRVSGLYRPIVSVPPYALRWL